MLSLSSFFVSGFTKQEFNWEKYLKKCGAKAAPENLFREVSLCKNTSNYRNIDGAMDS